MLIDGTVFDESYKRGSPFTFTLGKGEVRTAGCLAVSRHALRMLHACITPGGVEFARCDPPVPTSARRVDARRSSRWALPAAGTVCVGWGGSHEEALPPSPASGVQPSTLQRLGGGFVARHHLHPFAPVCAHSAPCTGRGWVALVSGG